MVDLGPFDLGTVSATSRDVSGSRRRANCSDWVAAAPEPAEARLTQCRVSAKVGPRRRHLPTNRRSRRVRRSERSHVLPSTAHGEMSFRGKGVWQFAPGQRGARHAKRHPDQERTRREPRPILEPDRSRGAGVQRRGDTGLPSRVRRPRQGRASRCTGPWSTTQGAPAPPTRTTPDPPECPRARA